MNKNKPEFNLKEVLLITLVATLIMGFATGYSVYSGIVGSNKYIKSDDKNINLFLEAYDSILENYYGKVDKESLINGAISGMTLYLDDPYTVYLNEPSKEQLIDSLKGTYEGVGVEITQLENNDIIIVSVFENSPAFKAGIKKGDILKKINGISLEDKKADDAVTLIKEKADGTAKIEVLRDAETLTFNLKRETLNTPNLESAIYEENNKKIGYISLLKFTDNVSRQFKEKLTKLEAEGIDCLIIDVRNNSGGYLNGATEIAEIFLEENKVVYSLKDRFKTTTYKDKTKEHKTYPVLVMINKASASASEILAGALKYSYGATLLGETSFGKGKVQQTSDLENGGMIKYTSAEWLMPNGKGIQDNGIKPDIEVKVEVDEEGYPISKEDIQLKRAIEELGK